MAKRNRNIEAFSLSFLDCICCGFGAIVHLYVIINARASSERDNQVLDLRGEVSLLQFEVLKGERNRVQVRNALDETIQEMVRTEGRSRELIAQITRIEEELSSYENTTVATEEHINKLKADILSMEEERKRQEQAGERE